MIDKPENRRAFPLPVSDHNQGYEGMTLRDYFATAALPAIMNGVNMRDLTANMPEYVAHQAYKIADEMLKAGLS